jgi:hypothetical protein
LTIFARLGRCHGTASWQKAVAALACSMQMASCALAPDVQPATMPFHVPPTRAELDSMAAEIAAEIGRNPSFIEFRTRHAGTPDTPIAVLTLEVEDRSHQRSADTARQAADAVENALLDVGLAFQAPLTEGTTPDARGTAAKALLGIEVVYTEQSDAAGTERDLRVKLVDGVTKLTLVSAHSLVLVPARSVP